MTILVDPASKPIARANTLDGGTIVFDQAAGSGLAIVILDASNLAIRYALRSVDDNRPSLARLDGAPTQNIIRATESHSLRLSFDQRVAAPSARNASIGLLALGLNGFFVVAEYTDALGSSPVEISLSDWKTQEEFKGSQDFEWYSEWSLVSVDQYGERTVVIE